MVNERNTVQPECTSTFRSYGFTTDTTRDFMRCPSCGMMIFPDSTAGRFDTVISFPVGYGKTYWGAVEVKYGGKTSLPFNRVEEKQRLWYDKKKVDYDMWLWFCLGNRINGRNYPRKTWLIPFSLFLELEEKLDRKSIPFDCKEIEEYELVWAGSNQWEIPDSHEIWKNIKSNEV